MFIVQNILSFQYSFISVLALAIKSLAVIVLNGYLMSFHMFISKNGLTTYEFIINRLKNKAEVRPTYYDNAPNYQ